MSFFRSVALLALITFGSVRAFAPTQTPPSRTSALQAQKEDLGRKAAASFVAATYLFANVAATAPAFAVADDVFFGGSSQVIAGRSGGRAGGRSSSYRSSSPSRTTYRSQTTIVRPGPTVVVPSPAFGGYGYGYNPYGGLGLGLGLNAIGSIGEGMREYRQENEIRDARMQVEEARIKNAELEARLKQLENQQQQQQK